MMGLFDFIKDIGHKLGEHQASEKELETSLTEAVSKAQLGIQNFQLKLSSGLATLSGVASTQKDLELARLIVGNHKGVEKVNDDGLTVAPAAPVPQAATAEPARAGAAAAKMVTVKSGDTLSKIAKDYLGNANRYQEIFEANRPMLKSPDEIFPGQIIRVPAEALAAH